MTNKEIAARIEEAGHPVPGNLNRAKLEALAAEKGVSLADQPNSPTPAPDEPAPDYSHEFRLITPVMAVCGMSGDRSADPFSEDQDAAE